MSRKSLIILFTMLFLIIFFSPVEAANLNSVSYTISGDSSEIDTLELEPEFMINNIHPAKLNFAFDGDDFYTTGEMALNIIRQNNFKLYLHLMLASDIDGEGFGKAVGFSAATSDQLSFFLNTYYFIDDDLADHIYYQSGFNYRLASHSSLEFSLANQYWDLSSDVVKLGIKFNL